MKRSARLYRQARAAAFHSSFYVVSFLASVTWAARCYLEESAVMSGGALALILVALAALVAGVVSASNAVRLARLAMDEETSEWRRAIRPRL